MNYFARCSCCFTLRLLLVIIIAAFPSVSGAEPWDILVFPLSVRSAGMGDTGNADCIEAANLAYNPALIALMNSVQTTWSHSEVSYRLADIKLDGIIAGGGHQWRLNETLTIGGGLAAGYAKESYGDGGSAGDPTEWGSFERSYCLAAAAAVGYCNRARFGIGIDMKRWKWDNAHEDEDFRQIHEAAVYDGGLAAAVTLLRRNDYTIEAVAGYAYSNFGGPIETIQDPDFFPPVGDITAPAYRRYGLAIRFDSPSWGRANKKFEMKLPAVSAAFNYDIIDEVFFSRYSGTRHALGGEIGAFKMLFLRAGRIGEEEIHPDVINGKRNFVDTTWGIGVGMAFRRCYFRFDYAQQHLDKADVILSRYGLVFDAGF